MTNRSKAKGTAWESAVVAFLQSCGLSVERRALSGAKDRGDISGIPDLVIECKSAKTIDLAGWVDELAVEIENDGARHGVLVVKRRGKSSPAEAYAVMKFSDWLEMYAE